MKKKFLNLDKTGNKIVLIIGILIVLLAIGFLVYGLVQHEEETVANFCLRDGNYFLIEGEECSTIIPGLWDRKNIPLSVVPYGPDHNLLSEGDEGFEEIIRAAREFNRQIGFTFFRFDIQPDVNLYWQASTPVQNKNALGWTNFFWEEDKIIRADGYISNTSEIDLTQEILLHKLGHIAGLAHDDFEDSVMFPHRREQLTKLRISRFTDRDKIFLRGTYGLEKTN